MQFFRQFRLFVVPVAFFVATFTSCQSSSSLPMMVEESPSPSSTSIHATIVPMQSAAGLSPSFTMTPPQFTGDSLVLPSSSGEYVTFGCSRDGWYAETTQGRLPVGGKNQSSIGAYLSWLGGQEVSVVRSRLHIISSTSSPTGIASVYLGKLGLLGGAPGDAEDVKPAAKRSRVTVGSSPNARGEVFHQSAATGGATGRLYDVFISHAGEEGESLAIPLYNELLKRGLRPFLGLNTSSYRVEIPTEIKSALDCSRSGVFFLSPNFIAKEWPVYELTYLQNRQESASHTGDISLRLLPVFYACSRDDCKLSWQSLQAKYQKYFNQHGFQYRVDSGSTNYPQLSAALSKLSACKGITSEVGVKPPPSWWIEQTVDALYTMLRSPCAQVRSYYSQKYATIPSLFEDANKPVGDLSCTLQYIADERNVEQNNDSVDEIAMYYERCACPKKSIAKEDLFKNRSIRPYELARPIRRVLLIGLPGVGKTTLGQQLAYLWSQGSWGQEFKAVYLLFFSALQSDQYDDSTYSKRPTLSTAIINNCFPVQPDNELEYNILRQQVKVTLEDSSTLLILDDLNERETPGSSDSNTQEKLLEAAKIGNHKLLILSRAYSVAPGRSIVDLEIEHVGLSDAQLESYLQDATLSGLSSEQGMHLLSLLRQHASMFVIAHAPVNLSLLCYFYKNDTTNVTETIRQGSLFLLYKRLTTYIWEHYRHNVQVFKSNIDLAPECRERVFSMLGELALFTLKAGKMLVDCDILARQFEIDFDIQLSEMQELGFLLLKFLGSTNQYQFPHLTFQEYFAARCLADQLTSEDVGTKAAGEGMFLAMCRASRYGRTLSFLSGALSECEGTVGIRRLLSLGAGVQGSFEDQTSYILLQLRLLNEWLYFSGPAVIEVELPDLLAKYQTSDLLEAAYRAVLDNIDADKYTYRQFTRSAHAFGYSLQHLPVYWQSIAATIQKVDDAEMCALATETLGDLVRASPSLAPVCLPVLLAAVSDGDKNNGEVYNAVSDSLWAVSQGLAYYASLDLSALCDGVSDALQDVQQCRAFHWTLLSLVQINLTRLALVQAQGQVAPARLDALLSPSPPSSKYIFGVQAWRYYYGDVGGEPDLPADIDNILDEACPFWGQAGKKVRDTHLLTLIPAKVDGENFSLDLLRDLITYPACVAPRAKYRWYDSCARSAFGATSPEASYWVLMMRDVLPGTRKRPYAAQKRMADTYASRGYALPKILEAVTSILAHHVRTGERLFSDSPWSFTRCSEQVQDSRYPLVVGGFGSDGIHVSDFVHATDRHGVSLVRKFY